MKGSDIIYLRPRVFQLENGCSDWEWDTDGANTAMISYGGINVGLEPILFGEKDHVL